MVIDYKKFDLFGKLAFEKAVIAPPFSKPHSMEDEACFLYILDGIGIEVSETEEVKIAAREAVLMKCGNYIAKMTTSETSGTYSAFSVRFYPDVLKKIYGNDLPTFLKERKNSGSSSMAKMGNNILIDKFINDFLFYFENPHLMNDELLILKLKEIIFLLYNSHNSSAVHTILSNLFSPESFTIQQIIESHQYSNITVEELAVLCNLSLSTFKREFKKLFEATPAAYIKNKKLERAAELLSISKMRISEICLHCGFEDVSHFSKSFHKKFGAAPSEFRLNQIDQ